MRSNRLSKYMRFTLILSLGLATSVDAQLPAPVPAHHCRTGESLQFSCKVGPKLASLCAVIVANKIEVLTYRYGKPDAVENEFIARADNINRFFATASPASPGALVKQIWFDKSDVRYLLTECAGGHCSKTSGLAVLVGDRIAKNSACLGPPAGNVTSFSRDLVSFGSDAGSTRSHTGLIQVEDADNNIGTVYSSKTKTTR